MKTNLLCVHVIIPRTMSKRNILKLLGNTPLDPAELNRLSKDFCISKDAFYDYLDSVIKNSIFGGCMMNYGTTNRGYQTVILRFNKTHQDCPTKVDIIFQSDEGISLEDYLLFKNKLKPFKVVFKLFRDCKELNKMHFSMKHKYFEDDFKHGMKHHLSKMCV